MATKERKIIRIDFPVDTEVGEHGLVYVTCPLIRGLLLALEGDKDLADKVSEAVTAMDLAMRQPTINK